MKILHTVGGFSIAGGGGITTCTFHLLNALCSQPGIKASLLTPIRPGEDVAGLGLPWLRTVPNDYRTPLALSRNLREALEEAVREYDVFHTNGLWMHVNHLTASIARKAGKPYVISPHGMLFPEAIRRNYWKKWPMIKAWFNRDIRHASAIHVTSSQEADAVRTFGYKGHIEIIPNPVDLPAFTEEIFNERLNAERPNSIGFLGRVHPRKGVDLLIRGLAQSIQTTSNAPELLIIGSGETAYMESLRQLAGDLGVADRVTFAGFVDGRKKFELLASLSALFVPSDFENFGMIVPEALSVGTPVMASLRTPWESLTKWECGWWTDRTPDAIADVIAKVGALTPEKRTQMARNGRTLAQSFTPDAIAPQMAALYSSL